MRSSLRRALGITVLLVGFLIPGLLQARTPAWGQASVGRPAVEWRFFSMVWSLLMDFSESGEGFRPSSSVLNKNGGMVDPSGKPIPPPVGAGSHPSAPQGDNGGMVDPSGG